MLLVRITPRLVRRCACAVVGLGIAALSWTAMAQLAPTPEPGRAEPARPKIGLVLSGGGARGAAHIGVLKVLEELRVPVDVIAGTSMGSIIGASYATGLTVPQMEKVIGSITTDKLFTDKPPRADQSMRQKTDDETPYIIPELGIGGDGIALPKGVVTGVALEGELRRLVQIGTARSFDELPIPFRAIATDIGTGEMVVLKEGSVVQAIRASMSVPGAVAPVTIGNRQLVDGGLVRNLPVDIAREMGADVIIAVNLGTPLLRPDQITSVFSVTMQMINILTEQNVNRSLQELRPSDILIVPELGDFSAGDFDNLRRRCRSAKRRRARWRIGCATLSLPPEQYAALRKQQAAPADKGSDRRRGDQGRRHQAGLARGRAAVAADGSRKAARPQHDRSGHARVSSDAATFENVNYAIDEIDGKQTLVVLVKEKPERDYFRFGLELDADLGKQSNFNLFASYRSKWLNKWGGEWRTTSCSAPTCCSAPSSTSRSESVSTSSSCRGCSTAISPLYLFEDTIQIAQYQEATGDRALDLGANIIQYGDAAGRCDLRLSQLRAAERQPAVSVAKNIPASVR